MRKNKILFLAANPYDTTVLQLKKEYLDIQTTLLTTEYRKRFEVNADHATTGEELDDLFQRIKPTIVHFSAHGTENGSLVLHDSRGNREDIAHDVLSEIFQIWGEGIKVVILNACYSETQARAIARHVDCVIGMPREIYDDDAITFAKKFYYSLGFGKDVFTAYRAGVIELRRLGVPKECLPKIRKRRGTDPSKLYLVSSTRKKKSVLNNTGPTIAQVSLNGSSDKPIDLLYVETESGFYNAGETVRIRGNVGSVHGGEPVLIWVTSPTGAAARSDQVPVAADGSYAYSFPAGGPLMQDSGTYNVRVTYAGVSQNTTFTFKSADGGWMTASLVIDGQSRYDTLYQIVGGSLQSLTGDSYTSTITATLKASTAGQLRLQLPRNVFDSIDNRGSNLDFIAFIDEIETIMDDDHGQHARTLTLSFIAGTERVDIVGTRMARSSRHSS